MTDMKKIIITALWLLIPAGLTAQDSLQAITPTTTEVIGTTELAGNQTTQKAPPPKMHKKKRKTKEFRVLHVDSVLRHDSAMSARVEELRKDMIGLKASLAETMSERNSAWRDQSQSLSASTQLAVRLSMAALAVLVILLVTAVAMNFWLGMQIRRVVATSVPEPDMDTPTPEPEVAEPAPEPAPEPLTEADCVAYNDAVHAFVNINNYVHDLRRYNALISPYISWFASDDMEQPQVDFSGLPDEERSKIALLVSKIGQFKHNHVPAINRYLARSQKKETFSACTRCPINGSFSPELDQHLFGDDLETGNSIKAVYKLGFFFPDSKDYPYREKSMIL